MRDYLSNIPAELFELILVHLSGVDLTNLKQINKKFKNSLNNPTALRLIFNDQFKSSTEKIKFVDDSIDWNEEMNRIKRHARKKRVAPSPVLARADAEHPIQSLKVINNNLLVNGYAPFDIPSCLKQKKIAFTPMWEAFHIIGEYAGRIQPDQQGCHHFYDILGKSRLSYKKLFESTKSTLKSFNKTLAILKDEKTEQFSVWNLNILCKHTEEVLWRRSTKKKEICNECSYICTLEDKPEEKFYEDCYCSQINQKLILIPKHRSLHVIRPLKGDNFVIEWSDGTISFPAHNFRPHRPDYQTRDLRAVIEEQQIDIDGTLHHIVHCIVDKKHRFYDLTTKKMTAVIDCWPVHKWIPNTCNIALAAKNEVIIIDFYQKKIISRFELRKGPYRWNDDKEEVFAMHATRSSQLLIIAQAVPYASTSSILVYSAVTGAYIATICAVDQALKNYRLDLSDDEKTLIAWNESATYFYDLKDFLTQPKLEKNKLQKK